MLVVCMRFTRFNEEVPGPIRFEVVRINSKSNVHFARRVVYNTILVNSVDFRALWIKLHGLQVYFSS